MKIDAVNPETDWHDCGGGCGIRCRPGQYLCRACDFNARVSEMMRQAPEDQDWEFAHCEECGSRLMDGVCMNTNCGNSPHQGEDWL
jgi:hypothetical protein